MDLAAVSSLGGTKWLIGCVYFCYTLETEKLFEYGVNVIAMYL
jgi:hypothetical protein